MRNGRTNLDSGDVLVDDFGNKAVVRAACFSPSDGGDIVFYRFYAEPVMIGALARMGSSVPDHEGSSLTFVARLDALNELFSSSALQRAAA